MKNIDVFLEDLFGDDSYKDFSDQTKASLALLSYLYSRQAMNEEEREDFISDADEWLSAMDIGPTYSVKGLLQICREKGILNKADRFRKGKGLGDSILWILFASVLEGHLSCNFEHEKGDYMFKITEAGQKKVEGMIGDNPSKQ